MKNGEWKTENGKCRLGETFACARCGRPVVRKSYGHKYCLACAVEAEREMNRENHRRRNDSWARRRAAERVEAMLRRERLLSEIGRDRPSRVYVWRDCVVEWRGTAPSF